ncbi:MAG: hypothetical protein IJY70_00510, partial [Clostridia bacterium]|nr:hypothetical protein [Clostridia bacterium]
VTLSFKPTKFSQSAVLYIDNAVLPSESISSFYRRLFVSYTKMSKNEREKVIHKHNYELLLDAIARNVKVCIKTANGFVADKVSVFAVASAKDELFNYILGFDGKTNITMRLASVETVVCLSSSANIPDDFKSLLERQLACSPQYPIYKSDNEPIVVQLTPKGKTLFEKIYLYRPTPEKIEGDLYTFNCSGNQVLYYFERFGENALILSPKRLGIFMRNYYHFALKKYKTIYRDGNQNGPGSNKR